MIEAFLHLFHSRHGWRTVSFTEMNELYMSMSMRTLALSLIGIFMPVLLYELGNSVRDIALFFALAFGLRIPGQFFFGYVAARLGPKHVLRYSYVFLLLLLVLLLTLEDQDWPLWMVSLAFGWHQAAFFIGYHVDFSKIRSHSHSGSQVGNMMILLKVASGIGPFVGGIVASLFDIRWTIALAIAFIIGGVAPLLASGEPVRTHQKLVWKGLFSRKHWRLYAAHAGVGIDQTAAVFIWPLLLGAFIFVDNVYASIGAVISFSYIVSIGMSYGVGKIVDAKRGQYALVNLSSILLAGAHLARVFAASTLSVLGIGLVTEAGVIGTRIQFTKYYYEKVDSLEGQRIAAVVAFESANAASRVVLWLVVALATTVVSSQDALYAGILFGIIGSALLLAQNQPIHGVRK